MELALSRRVYYSSACDGVVSEKKKRDAVRKYSVKSKVLNLTASLHVVVCAFLSRFHI